MNSKNINMTCIEEGLLLKYIDGECTENESGALSDHLQICPLADRGISK